VSGLFLDIQKAFDTVNHQILLQKLYDCGVRGVAHAWFSSYLNNRQQCVKINGVFSDMGTIRHGVPQGSVLGATLFLVYVNDLCSGRFKGQITAFADDTALSYVSSNWSESESKILSDLETLKWWFSKNKLVLSTMKTNCINFSLRNSVEFENKIMYKCLNCLNSRSVCIKCSEISGVKEVKYLGVILDSELNWKNHILKMKAKLLSGIRLFYYLREVCSIQTLRCLYYALVNSRLEYAIVAWGGTYRSTIIPIEKIQKWYVRLILMKNSREPSHPCFVNLKILPLRCIYIYKVLKAFFLKSGNLPSNINFFRIGLRNASNFRVPKPNITYFTKTFNYTAPRLFNKLPKNIKCIKNICKYLNSVKHWLLGKNREEVEELLSIVQ
jgi:hypothetical protein